MVYALAEKISLDDLEFHLRGAVNSVYDPRESGWRNGLWAGLPNSQLIRDYFAAGTQSAISAFEASKVSGRLVYVENPLYRMGFRPDTEELILERRDTVQEKPGEKVGLLEFTTSLRV